jgi:hypothetical protein
MDALNRESRWQRGSTERKVRITALDLKILFLLLQYRYLSTSAIAAFLVLHADKKWIQERLGQLYRAGYVDRPPTQREFFNSNYRDLIYELDAAGERALKQHGMWDEEAPVAWLSRGRHGRTMFPHSVMVCEVLAHFAIALQDPELDMRFIPWSEIRNNMPVHVRTAKDVHSLPVDIEEILNRKSHRSTKALTPDAVFGIEYPDKRTRFFAIEADRGSEPLMRDNLNQTSIMRKVLQYKAAFKTKAYKTRWGLPNLFATFITTLNPDSEAGKKRMREMTEVAEFLIGPSKFFLFNTLASFGGFEPPEQYTGRFLTEPWDRPGNPALDIDRPD